MPRYHFSIDVGTLEIEVEAANEDEANAKVYDVLDSGYVAAAISRATWMVRESDDE